MEGDRPDTDWVYASSNTCIYGHSRLADQKILMSQAWPFALLTFVLSILIAYACLKLYDEPVRRWLKKKVLLKVN
ncbi:MAG TPA: hypothetical protein VLS85_03650 [Hanamia sp.]|nr:hypothetical protein [Hanamia sp.]